MINRQETTKLKAYTLLASWALCMAATLAPQASFADTSQEEKKIISKTFFPIGLKRNLPAYQGEGAPPVFIGNDVSHWVPNDPPPPPACAPNCNNSAPDPVPGGGGLGGN